MQSYQINELERLTGIKAHTIRIWEKRYELIKPHRTTTNRRYYDDSQVKKLLNVTTLLSYGYKISKIAVLTENEINKFILLETHTSTHDTSYITYINDLIQAMLAFDEITFEKTFTNVVQVYGMSDAILNVIYPFLSKTGVLWNTDKAIPVQEHFANNIIRRKILAAIDILPAATEKKEIFMLFLPPGEWHETALLYADYIIRAAGHKTIYLGQNVPYENISKITPALHPSYLLLFYIATKPAKEIHLVLNNLSKENPDIRILVSGNPELFQDIKSLSKNITYLSDVNKLYDFTGKKANTKQNKVN